MQLTATGKGISSMKDRCIGGTSHHDRKSTRQQSKSSSSTSSSQRHRSSSGNHSRQQSVATLEDSYTRATSRVSPSGDYYYYGPKQLNQDDDVAFVDKQHPRHSNSNDSRSSGNRKESSSSARTSISSNSSNRHSSSSSSSASDRAIPTVPKKSVSDKDPSEETITVFGDYGVTGHYILQLAMEAGYKVRALVLPGITMSLSRQKIYVWLQDHYLMRRKRFDVSSRTRRTWYVCWSIVTKLFNWNDSKRMLVPVPPIWRTSHPSWTQTTSKRMG